ncbi:hypothetical protein ID866_8194 [Astraeus odoratus]|nr:hypothetical protein ID866_8194 [Astraeus odoratus]
MKFSTIIAVVAAAAVVSAETNAQRFARGLPPLSPARRGSGAESAKKSKPSSTSNPCKNGSLQCCSSTGSYGSDTNVDSIVNLLDIGNQVSKGEKCGLSCSHIGVGQINKCTGQTVCCNKNNWNGVINVGCSNINL